MSARMLASPKKLQHQLLTIEDFLAHCGDCPADLVEGKIVKYAMPGGIHGIVCGNAYEILKVHVRKKKLGHVFSNDTHVRIRKNPDTARGMDVAYVSYARIPKGSVPEGALKIVPELVVEVRSPSDRWVQILGKVFDYLDLGVDVVMVLDPKTTSASLFRGDDRQETFNAEDTIRLPDLLPGFAAPVAKFFA